jgi:uncharacterized membrane protein (UPF0127 family)
VRSIRSIVCAWALPALAGLALGALGACDDSAGTPLVVIVRQTAAAEAESQQDPKSLDYVTAAIGETELALEVASAPEDRQAGLSGRTGLEPGAGMLFHFPSGSATGLWMKGMLFGLDFVWVGADCTVVDLHERVPAPTGPDDSLPIYRPGTEAASVIEIAAGGVRAAGIERGDRVRYGPSRSGAAYGC